MLERYAGGVLVIKHYALGLKGTCSGGYIKVYVAKAKDTSDYNRGLVNDKGKVEVDKMVDITEAIARLFGEKTNRDGKLWYPGVGFDRNEYIAREIQRLTNGLFDSRTIGVYGRGNRIS